MVFSVDYKKVNNNNICFSRSGTQNENITPIEWAKEFVDLGIGELLITSIDKDGQMSGCDLEFLEEVSHIIDIPIIASGGVSCYNDFLACIKAGCDAVAAASIFHFTELTPNGAKQFLKERNIPVRL